MPRTPRTGRPALPAAEKASRRVTVNFTPDEGAAVDRAARAANRDASPWLKRLAIAEAAKVAGRAR